MASDVNVKRNRRSITEDELNANAYLADLEISSSEMCYKSTIVEWKYASDITDENENLKVYTLLLCFLLYFCICV